MKLFFQAAMLVLAFIFFFLALTNDHNSLPYAINMVCSQIWGAGSVVVGFMPDEYAVIQKQ